jgi:YHS domain-containing protein
MGAIIVRILLLALVIWVIRYVLMSIQGIAKNDSKKSPDEEPGVMVKDPVCGMYMDPRLAIRLDKSGKRIYFCSENCKSKYISDPANTLYRS